VFRIAAEFQNVPLREPDMFQQFPQRMVSALGPFAAQSDRHGLDCGIEIRMRSSTFEQVQHVFTKRLGVHKSTLA